MINWDDNTDTIEYVIKQKEYDEVVEYKITEFRREERFICTVVKDGQPFGDSAKYNDREQVLAWIRLMLGDYVDCYRGIA